MIILSETAVVTTTIGLPRNFPEIYKNAEEYDHDIHLYVVGDHKTPTAKINAYLRRHIPRDNYTILSIRNQMGWLNRQYGRNLSKTYRRVFQENNYQRRIIGFLIATQEGAKRIIAVDDDNYPREEVDYVGTHLGILGEHEDHITCLPNTTYINLLDFLDKEKTYDSKIYVRGYPVHLRGDIGYVFNKEDIDVKVNVGLWSGAPDIDALSRIGYGDVRSVYKNTTYPIAIAKNAYTSMCLQNICFDTEYLITQYEFPMNVPIYGDMRIGRYDDIWAGYVCKKILDQCDKHMTFGPPVAIHDRHPHNYLKDLSNEFWGMWINMFFYSAIQNMRISDVTPDPWSMFTEIIVKLRGSLKFGDMNLMHYLARIWNDMYMWAKMVEGIGL